VSGPCLGRTARCRSCDGAGVVVAEVSLDQCSCGACGPWEEEVTCGECRGAGYFPTWQADSVHYRPFIPDLVELADACGEHVLAPDAVVGLRPALVQ
jgi:DnaJ-class molecular chaperone